MALYVQKFGGTSVGTPERIEAVAEQVIQTVHAGHKVVVVVSAMAGYAMGGGDTLDVTWDGGGSARVQVRRQGEELLLPVGCADQ